MYPLMRAHMTPSSRLHESTKHHLIFILYCICCYRSQTSPRSFSVDLASLTFMTSIIDCYLPVLISLDATNWFVVTTFPPAPLAPCLITSLAADISNVFQPQVVLSTNILHHRYRRATHSHLTIDQVHNFDQSNEECPRRREGVHLLRCH
jgi:hypothetical protein